MRRTWKRMFGVLLAFALAAAFVYPVWAEEHAPGREAARQATEHEAERVITADHSRHEALRQEFTSPEQVTAACLSCHNVAGEQFMNTVHWTWLSPESPDGTVGKAGLVVNNFCINIQSNEPRCTSCHAGYGWANRDFDFSDANRIDCLVCHEQTGTYKKFPSGAGYPARPMTEDPDGTGRMGQMFPGNGRFYPTPDYNAVAQSVGRPTRRNCGTCHFFGGGGNGVKHGDLDSSMTNPSVALDVHMGVAEDGQGNNFDCIRCHTTVRHQVAGRIYTIPASVARTSLIEDDQATRITCESCHTTTPHESDKPNDHTDRVACQSCHIPTFARALPTKMYWDWSTAGQMNEEGRPFVIDGPLDRHSYDSRKGNFVWEMNVTPEYFWYNGSINTLTAEDQIDPSDVVWLGQPMGSMDDPNSRIMPFKVHRGRTPYDPGRNTMVIPHLFGRDPDAYWKGYDWTRAVAAGMRYAGLPFSGEVDFVDTAFVYPTTHQVAPAANHVACAECHSHEGRLASLGGFYMPGRDSSQAVDVIGWGIVVISLLSVILHGLMRLFSRKGREEE